MMSLRQIVLDTETTGIRVEDGHKIIEIGCIEMINRKLTGNHFHCYINPEREIEAGALAVHGITNEFLHDKPVFSLIAQDLMDFISDAELIIHNAPFDVSFLNNELKLTNQGFKSITHYCRVTDTLQMARQLHAGQRNSLDALCKRYAVDNSKRDLHGALLDAHLLAQVYLAMTGGQGSFFDSLSENQGRTMKQGGQDGFAPLQKHQLKVLEATAEELSLHEDYLRLLEKQGKCLWLKDT
jgi:DNA polymerase III subunit epsilon